MDELSPRLQRMRMRLMHYDFEIQYTPGKDIIAADYLSRSSSLTDYTEESDITSECEAHILAVLELSDLSDLTITKIIQGQRTDETCKKLQKLIMDGWEDKRKLDIDVKLYYQFQDTLTVNEGIIMRGTRIIISKNLRGEALRALHLGHQGFTKCYERAKYSVWWPGITGITS